MKKALLFLLTVCFIFASFAFCVSAEEEYEEYEGKLCLKNVLKVTSTQFVDPDDYVGEGPFDFFGVSIVEFEFLRKGTFENQEYEKYRIKVAPDVDTVEARKQLMQNEFCLIVSYDGVDRPSDDETETPVSKTVEFTESVFTFVSFDRRAMSDLGFEHTPYGKDFEPIIIDSRETIDALANCDMHTGNIRAPEFDEYFAKYDDGFFETNALVVVFAEAGGYDYKYEVLSLEYAEDGETLVFGFECSNPLGSAPDALEYAFVMAEVKKADIANCTSITTEYSEFKNVWGDVNGDQAVNSYDYLIAKRAAFGTYTLDEEEFERADVYMDRYEVINSADYLLIKRIAFGTYVA